MVNRRISSRYLLPRRLRSRQRRSKHFSQKICTPPTSLTGWGFCHSDADYHCFVLPFLTEKFHSDCMTIFLSIRFCNAKMEQRLRFCYRAPDFEENSERNAFIHLYSSGYWSLYPAFAFVHRNASLTIPFTKTFRLSIPRAVQVRFSLILTLCAPVIKILFLCIL